MCLFEVGALLGSPAAGQPVLPNPAAGPWTVFPVTVRLSRVIDLCDAARLQLIDTSIPGTDRGLAGLRDPGRRRPAAYGPDPAPR